uniref:SEA domain-containing protein n=1 Tax=Loa loa TaxID=7209 RepID=A0A1I7VRG4_LOALO
MLKQNKDLMEKNLIFSVLIIKFPPSSPISSTTYQPEPITFTPLSTLQPFPPLFPTPLPPYKPPIITMLPFPTDRLQKRVFLCQMYLLNQANEAYANHNSFEYHQTSQRIQNAIDNQLKPTPLRPYLENVHVWYLYNSGPHLAVEFSLIMLIPSHANIGLTSVKNVFLSILPGIEDQLNGTYIDRNSISIQYLHI